MRRKDWRGQRLLVKPYCWKEKLATNWQGNQLRFPDANLDLSNPHQLIPKTGIYFSRAVLESGRFFGLTNIGSSPTVKQTGIIEIETYILDFSASLYGQSMEVELLEYLREEKSLAV
jgi:riboflavin kinase/FMN adenylyltransferase